MTATAITSRRTQALVDVEWASDHLADPQVRFIEVDVDTSAYDTGHLPGAVGFNWTTQLNDPDVRDLASRAFRGLTGLEKAAPIPSQAGELSTFTDRGYENAFAVIGIHRWFHTVGDTLDCVDADLLAPVLEGHQRTIELAVERAG